MNKKLLFIFPLLILSLVGCSKTDSSSNSSSSSESSSDSSSIPTQKLATFKFFIDYSHSDDPLYTMKWYIGVPLGECPEEAELSDSDATDPLFPHFIGYSIYSSSNDDSLLWDFSSDVATGQSAVLLYGIWTE